VIFTLESLHPSAGFDVCEPAFFGDGGDEVIAALAAPLRGLVVGGEDGRFFILPTPQT